MRIADRELLRLLLQTDFHRLVTAAAEGTALRHVQKINRRSADRDQTLLAVVHIRYGTEQPLRIFMLCMVENIVCSPALTDASAVHDDDLVTHICDDAKVMRNHDDRHAEPLLKICVDAYELKKTSPHGGILQKL